MKAKKLDRFIFLDIKKYLRILPAGQSPLEIELSLLNLNLNFWCKIQCDTVQNLLRFLNQKEVLD